MNIYLAAYTRIRRWRSLCPSRRLGRSRLPQALCRWLWQHRLLQNRNARNASCKHGSKTRGELTERENILGELVCVSDCPHEKPRRRAQLHHVRWSMVIGAAPWHCHPLRQLWFGHTRLTWEAPSTVASYLTLSSHCRTSSPLTWRSPASTTTPGGRPLPSGRHMSHRSPTFLPLPHTRTCAACTIARRVSLDKLSVTDCGHS